MDWWVILLQQVTIIKYTTVVPRNCLIVSCRYYFKRVLVKYYVDSKEKTDTYWAVIEGWGLGISVSMRKIEPKTTLAVETPTN